MSMMTSVQLDDVFVRPMRLIPIAVLLCVATVAPGQLTPQSEKQIAAIAESTLRDTGVPSASVGIVVDGKVAYARAFGMARVDPPLAATADMAYPIGSISKQFTATAVLLLEEQGKLSIDDSVAKYFPALTRAKDVKLRNLMTMTSGYEDFAPQDYSIPAWYKPRNPADTVKEWAGKSLDFEPGTQWQYSNTNYVLLSLIVEKVTGEPLYQYLREHVLDAAKLDAAFNAYTDRDRLRTTGYISYALQVPRVLPLEAPGWYFGDGELAMPAATLLEWDLTIINKSILKPESYKQFETAFVTKDGKDTGYGLGVKVARPNGHLRLEHGGEVGGYVAENIVYPDDKIAIVVLTNEVASSAAATIGAQLTALLLPAAVPAEAAPDAVADALPGILASFAKGQIDRTLFTANCNAYFSAEAVADFKTTLAPLGAVKSVYRTRAALRGGMTFGEYRVVFADGTTLITNTYTWPDGKIEQFLITGRG
jgi:CubicO group peptidase (beta-lactamase class C family)